MANVLRIKRRAAGGAAGAPSSLENAELAYNEQDNTLYYGFGTGGAGGSATAIIPIGGKGAYIEVREVPIYHHPLTEAECASALAWLHAHDLPYFLETNEGLFANQRFLDVSPVIAARFVAPVVVQISRDPVTMKRGVTEIYFNKWSAP